jgi:hypothetical protein
MDQQLLKIHRVELQALTNKSRCQRPAHRIALISRVDHHIPAVAFWLKRAELANAISICFSGKFTQNVSAQVRVALLSALHVPAPRYGDIGAQPLAGLARRFLQYTLHAVLRFIDSRSLSTSLISSARAAKQQPHPCDQQAL